MANFYTDTPELKYHLNHPLMQRVCRLKERDYSEKGIYDDAPSDFADAMDSYDKVLNLVGDLCANIIAPNAEDVDHQGPSLSQGRVSYAPATAANLQATRQAGLMGMNMPRRYGGLNFPTVPYIMAADMVSRADAGFENLWGLQDCAETLYEFGSEEQRKEFIPRVCAGETMSMDLTEPDAGSDLQSVMLQATYCPEEGFWRLNGVKRFITNGDADIHLVLARSQEGTKDGRGLSMFIYDKRDGGVNVRRIENKMGIKGSPTCELVFRDAKAQLCGKEKMGLIKYVMALMNGARLGIAAQSVGISQAAYNQARAYAVDRKQFHTPIIEFPAVAYMLDLMKAKLDASRAILYETARFVDVYKALDDISRERPLTSEERQEQKHYARLADALTPLAKGLGSEYANQNAYDCIQVHGGSGFMKEYACERLYRDARITSIYEGTTQLQVVASIRYATNGTYAEMLDNYASLEVSTEAAPLKKRLDALIPVYRQAVADVLEVNSQPVLDLLARPLVEMAGNLIMGYLMVRDASCAQELFGASAQTYVAFIEAESAKHSCFIKNHCSPKN